MEDSVRLVNSAFEWSEQQHLCRKHSQSQRRYLQWGCTEYKYTYGSTGPLTVLDSLLSSQLGRANPNARVHLFLLLQRWRRIEKCPTKRVSGRFLEHRASYRFQNWSQFWGPILQVLLGGIRTDYSDTRRAMFNEIFLWMRRVTWIL